jgi:hypothetical protein
MLAVEDDHHNQRSGDARCEVSEQLHRSEAKQSGEHGRERSIRQMLQYIPNFGEKVT